MSGTVPILVIGHVTRDLIDGEARLGGAATFVARALSTQGKAVALATRAPDDPLLEPLVTDPCIRLHRLPTESFTVFRHRPLGAERRLRLEACAAAITVADIPPPWFGLPLVFLVPVIGECDTGLLTAFPKSEIVAGVQGWLRATGPDGRVGPCVPPEALLAARLLVATLSERDHPEAEALARCMARHCRVVALTRGSKPITIFEKYGENDIPVEPVKCDHDPVGAGDVFTALLGLHIAAGDKAKTAVTEAARSATRFVAQSMVAG